MNSSSNISEGSSLANILNTVQNSNLLEIEINEQLQIFDYKEIKSNAYYTLTLCDNKYGFSNFLFFNPKNINDIQKGKKITIKKIKKKSIESKIFIVIKDYEINLEDPTDIPDIKLLKQKGENFVV